MKQHETPSAGKVYSQLIVTGTIGYDFIMDYAGRFADRIMPDKIHKISLSFLVDKLNKQYGGTAGNIAYTLKLLGADPLIVSMAGNDFGPYREFLLHHGLDLSGITVSERIGTGSYFVVTDREDNQIGSFYTGATRYAKRLKLGRHISDPAVTFAVLSPTEPAAMTAYVAECRQLGVAYLYDPAFQIGMFKPADLRDSISGAALLIGNDYEISLIEDRLDIPHEELLLMVPAVVTTLGSKGSVIETRTESIHVRPAKAANASDPTGAGDAYRAGFLAGYVRGFDLPTCGRMGSVAAVYTVEKYGTVTHEFSVDAFRKRYEENYHETLDL